MRQIQHNHFLNAPLSFARLSCVRLFSLRGVVDRPAMEKRAAPAPESLTVSSSRAGLFAARALGPVSTASPESALAPFAYAGRASRADLGTR